MFDYSAPANLLQDRTIVITGAGDGIGRVAAKTCAAHGATVVLIGRTLDKLEKFYDEIEAAGHPQPAIVPLNLESAGEHDYQELANKLEEEFGHIDGLLHNAGVLGELAPIEFYDIGTWHRVMHLNLTVPFVLTQSLYPQLRQSPDASVVLVEI